MNSYSILRNNKEHGPYTLKDLASQSLLSTDLIWIEGLSAAWRTPMEIDELKTLVKHPEAKNNVKTVVTVQPVIDETAPKQNTFKSAPSIFVSKPVKAIDTSSHFSIPYNEDSATVSEETKLLKERKKQSSLSYNFLGLGLLLIGGLMGAFVMKQMISSFGNQPAFSVGKAKEIESQNVPVSTSTHTAEASFTAASGETTGSTPVKKDSIGGKIKTSVKAPVTVALFKAEKNSKTTSDQELQAASLIPQNNPASGISKVSKEEESAGEEIKKQTSFKNSVELSANDYKVGLLGGVSGLQISVTNATPQNIENLLVEVEFLKPNGTVVKTEVVSVSNITAGASKSVAVPSSSRGVKVRYRVMSTNTTKETIATDNM